MPERVSIVCEDAGAAAALAVLAGELGDRVAMLVVGPHAEPVFARVGLRPTHRAVDAVQGVLVTGSTMWGDRIEAKAVLVARQSGARSVTFLDFWGNYVERLSYPSRGGLDVLPDHLAVIDDAMAKGVVAAGAPPGRVCVTGSPIFDELLRKPLLASIDAGPILFLNQPIEALYGRRLGYTEQDVLRELFRVADRTIRVRPHPRDGHDAIRRMLGGFPGVVMDESPTLEAACSGISCAVGMSTMALVELAVRGMKTISVQPGPDPIVLPTIHAGSTRLVTDLRSLHAALVAPGVVTRPDWPTDATRRLIALIDGG